MVNNSFLFRIFLFIILPAFIISAREKQGQGKEKNHRPPPIVAPVQFPINGGQGSNPNFPAQSFTTPKRQDFDINFPPLSATVPPPDPFRSDLSTEIPNNLFGEQRNRNKGKPSISCFSYDRRYQAETLQDAIMNFPDLTMNNWKVQQNANENNLQYCLDDQCRACGNTLLQRLETIGLVKADESERLRMNLNLGSKNSFLTTQQCPRLELTKRLQLTTGLNNGANNMAFNRDNDLTMLVDRLSKEGQQNWVSRPRRETNLNTIGHQFNVKCVKRGESLDQQTYEWIGLCSMCWVWRELPEGYFPQYINELVCDTDTKCLSGWGTCQQGSKNVDVLQKVESPPGNITYRPITLQSNSLCNCEIKAGSALHNLVNG